MRLQWEKTSQYIEEFFFPQTQCIEEIKIASWADKKWTKQKVVIGKRRSSILLTCFRNRGSMTRSNCSSTCLPLDSIASTGSAWNGKGMSIATWKLSYRYGYGSAQELPVMFRWSQLRARDWITSIVASDESCWSVEPSELLLQKTLFTMEAASDRKSCQWFPGTTIKYLIFRNAKYNYKITCIN